MSDSASGPRDTTGLPGGRNWVPAGFEEGLDWVRRGALDSLEPSKVPREPSPADVRTGCGSSRTRFLTGSWIAPAHLRTVRRRRPTDWSSGGYHELKRAAERRRGCRARRMRSRTFRPIKIRRDRIKKDRNPLVRPKPQRGRPETRPQSPVPNATPTGKGRRRILRIPPPSVRARVVGAPLPPSACLGDRLGSTCSRRRPFKRPIV